MVVLGHEEPVPVTMDEMLFLTRTVARTAQRPLVVGDMPFGSYHVSDEDAVRNAIRFIKEADADVVKLEGAGPSLSRVGAIVAAGIGVMGPCRADTTVRDDPRRLQDAGAHGLEGAASCSRTRSRSRRRAASPSCSRRCRSPVAARITEA
jgi:hypothetical protein